MKTNYLLNILLIVAILTLSSCANLPSEEQLRKSNPNSVCDIINF